VNGVMPDQHTPPALGGKDSRNLILRVIVAVLLAPLALMFVFAGGWLWVLLSTLVAIGLFYEWHSIVNSEPDQKTFATGVIALEMIGLALWFGWGGVAWAAVIVGLTLIGLASGEGRWWNLAGFAYTAAALIASSLIRLDEPAGFHALMFTLFVVWASDIGGYFAGRIVGGPRLWPKVSPNKTWAGAVGGLALSLGVAVVAIALGWGRIIPLVVLALALSVVSQLGDLLESAIKRHFGVKDSSQLLPGHGGLFDRLDGFVAAIIFAGLVGYLRAGADGIGRGFMIW
jgi:phosphatidate cytidylyltransferase